MTSKTQVIKSYEDLHKLHGCIEQLHEVASENYDKNASKIARIAAHSLHRTLTADELSDLMESIRDFAYAMTTLRIQETGLIPTFDHLGSVMGAANAEYKATGATSAETMSAVVSVIGFAGNLISMTGLAIKFEFEALIKDVFRVYNHEGEVEILEDVVEFPDEDAAIARGDFGNILDNILRGKPS